MEPPTEYRVVEEVFITRAIKHKLEEYSYIIDGANPEIQHVGPNEIIITFPVMGRYHIRVQAIDLTGE